MLSGLLYVRKHQFCLIFAEQMETTAERDCLH